MLSTLLLSLALPPSPVQEETPWLDLTYTEAKERAAEEEKPLFVYFYAPYDRTCDHLDAAVWQNGLVIDHLRFNTIPIRVDTSRSREICNVNDVTVNATMIWFTPEGEEMDRLVHDGKKNSTYFLDISNLILNGESDLQLRAAEAAANPEDGLKRVWYGRLLEHRGRFRHALAQYLSAFDHIENRKFDEYRRSELLFTIRQLFQKTNSIVELETRAAQLALTAKGGPDAVREQLGPEATDEEVRARLRRVAADAVAIRYVLQDHPELVEIYDSVEGLPHAALVREAMMPWVADRLVTAKRYEDVLAPIADLQAYADELYEEYEYRKERLELEVRRLRKWQVLPRALDPLGKQIGPVFTALLAVGRDDEAEAQARRLLDLTDSSDPWVVILQRAGQAKKYDLVQKLAAEGFERFEEGTRDYNRVRKMLRLHGGGE